MRAAKIFRMASQRRHPARVNARLIKILTVALLTPFGLSEAAASSEARRQVFSLQAQSIEDTYVISVSLPDGYHASPDAYPVLLMLDGEYAFASASEISHALQRNELVRPYIVVGVSYGVEFGAPLAAKRSRDFTPPTDSDGTVVKAPILYHAFLKEELIPAIAGRYRIHSDDITLWSYSLSGSFAAWLNYYDRHLFRNYIIASPNLGYGLLEKMMAGAVFVSEEPVAKKVVMSMDPTEIEDASSYFKPDVPEITDQVRELLGTFKGYDFRFHVTRGETHATSWMAALPSSLRFSFGPGARNENSKK